MTLGASPHISDSQARPSIATNSKLGGRACESAAIVKANSFG